AETDGDGARQQEKIAEIAARHRMRIMGPNCIGLVNFANGLYASFHPAFADAGRAGGSIGAITQSGAFGGLLHRMGRDRDIASTAPRPSRNSSTSGSPVRSHSRRRTTASAW